MDLIFETQRGSTFAIEVGYFDTVLEIKGKIEKYKRIPVSTQTLVFQGNVLQDDHNIEQCDLYNNSRLQLFISSPGTNDQNRSKKVIKTEQSPEPNSTEQSSVMMSGSSSKNNNNKKKLRVMLVLICGTMIPMEVNAGDTVGELRKELAKIQQKIEIKQLEEGYFFMHKKNVMDDDKSFMWHRVDHGDKIEIFSGTVSGGS